MLKLFRALKRKDEKQGKDKCLTSRINKCRVPKSEKISKMLNETRKLKKSINMPYSKFSRVCVCMISPTSLPFKHELAHAQRT